MTQALATHQHRQNTIANQAGFNLIEISIVLAIVGLVVGGIWWAASAAFDNLKQQNLAKGILSSAQNLTSMYSTIPTTTTIDSLTNLINSNVFPTDWLNGPAALKSPYGGAITLAGTVGATTMTFAALTRDQCAHIATRIANSSPGPTLISINASGSALSSTATGTSAFGNVTAAGAIGACPNATTNDLVFTFNFAK